MTQLTVYILCHNRPEDARRAIDSALNQSDPDFSLVISDNSSDDRVQVMVRQHFPQARCVRRIPMLAALDHFNQCIAEAAGTHLCLFHDDDLLAPNFVATVKAAILANPAAVAVGCNAWIESQGHTSERPSFLTDQVLTIIHSPLDLATRYFGRSQSGIAPFPGYTYRTAAIRSLRFNTDEGKYSDVSWLLRLCTLGPLVWIRQPLMTYRIHGGNDGLIESRKDRLKFLAFLKHQDRSSWTPILDDYRCAFIYKPMLRSKSSQFVEGHRLRLARSFLKGYRIRRWIRLDTYRSAWQRAVIKSRHSSP